MSASVTGKVSALDDLNKKNTKWTVPGAKKINFGKHKIGKNIEIYHDQRKTFILNSLMNVTLFYKHFGLNAKFEIKLYKLNSKE